MVISHFGFEGVIWVSITPVPGQCLLVTFMENILILLIYYLPQVPLLYYIDVRRKLGVTFVRGCSRGE